ncbi:hypothetical protein [Stigmatella erecta]|uniref:Lipoprotein n=1 Tax=Stigmatella erecta TaxID=83460 RepID=A0A1I0KS27_9BACT|nr:hypothetical protein [Stigmatella erecta]SEU27793.1 hypothetical protein SAMN05443639_11356 [Stigmatella erecta]
MRKKDTRWGWRGAVLSVAVAMGCGDETDVRREPVGSFVLPRDAVPNDNAAVGPFCCTGSTLVVEDPQGQGTLGYLHFFFWEGQAYNLTDTESIAPDLYLGVSARRSLDTGLGDELLDRISFSGDELRPGASKRVRIGALEYIATLTHVETVLFKGAPHFLMSSLEVSVDVLSVTDTP